VLDHFAANVTARRLDAGLTQGQFAELIDRDVRFVRMLEGAKSAPSFATICTIAHVLDLEVARLFVPAERPIVLTGRPRKTKK
jgi:transcriptional regulator with XRE-family HTH domain